MSKTRPTFEEAKASYVHRYTCEHRPAWATKPSPDGRRYAPRYATDREWYDNTIFPGEPGNKARKHCDSRNPSWPLGQWLPEPVTG